MRTFLLFLVAIACHAAHAGSVYKWIDEHGSVHYTDQPPPKGAKEGGAVQKHGGVVEVDKEPFATRWATNKHPVTLFIADECGVLCDQGKEYLDARGVPYATRKPDKNPQDAEALRKLAGGLEVPVLTIGDKTHKGWYRDVWEKALDEAGYPPSNPLSKVKSQSGGK